MRRMLLPFATLLLAAACTGERAGDGMDVTDGGEVETADSTFAGFAERQMGRLKAGTTLAQWTAASSRDSVTLADEPGAPADTLAAAGFCARATLAQPLVEGGVAVRHAYFYPPPPTPNVPLPSAGNRARLLREACTVGVIAVSGAGGRDTVAWLPAFAPGAPAASLTPVAAAAPAPDAPELQALAPGLACSSDAARFHRDLRAAEELARRTRDPRLSARLHLAIADTYADLIAMSYPPAGTALAADELEVPEPSGLRSSAADHYREALALDPTMPEARRAWGTAWRLLAGLKPDRAGC